MPLSETGGSLGLESLSDQARELLIAQVLRRSSDQARELLIVERLIVLVMF